MRQLTSLDTQFLAIEDGRNHAHVSILAIHDPSTAPGGRLTLDMVREHVASRIHLLPPFRWRVAEVPFGLDYPYWVDDADVDLDFHIRELALPEPGDERMLAEQVARIVGRELDRNRPLWELYLIHGLEGGRSAVLTKLHHAAVDGASGAEIMGVLLDSSPEGRDVPPATDRPGERMPSQLSMLGRGIAGLPAQPVRFARGLQRSLPHMDQSPTLRLVPGVKSAAALSRRAGRARRRSDGGVLEGRGLSAPRTSLNAPIGPHRRLALSKQSLSEVKRIKDHFGVTVNDVVVTICATALRKWLDGRGELPAEPLVSLIPVSVRTPEQKGTFGNRVSAMIIPLPTTEGDPVRRLQLAHEALISAKERHKATPASVMQDANNVIPPFLFARAARVSMAVAARHPSEAPVNTCVSNVPGSPSPLFLAGARMEAMYPVSAILDGVGLNFTVMSYLDSLDFGVVVDRDLMDDPWTMAQCLQEAQAELLALVPSRAKPRAKPRAKSRAKTVASV